VLVRQFRRLERDIGGKLYHRSTPRQPMRPTPLGAALLRALSQPGIRALAAAPAPGREQLPGPSDSRLQPRRRPVGSAQPATGGTRPGRGWP
jgi:DNA-binding transcriptional LysR family regulator